MQRSNSDIRFRFDDREMDFAFQYALGAAKTGGPEAGELFYIAAGIEDGNTSTWVREFEDYGDRQRALAKRWGEEGRRRSAGEIMMKAYCGYRQAWQFTGESDAFQTLIDKYEEAFADAQALMGLPLEFVEVPYGATSLPGMRLDAGQGSPTLIVIGGLDSCKEEMYHLIGLNAWRRGYTTFIVDLPGQGSTPRRGLHLMKETEQPIGVVVDYLIEHYSQDPARLALMGMSAGGYMISRAAMTERRIAAFVASTPIFDGGRILPRETVKALQTKGAMSDAFRMYLWRFGATTADEIADLIATQQADPSQVVGPFLSIAGTGEAPAFLEQARQWNDALSVEHKTLIELDAASGADAHCQVNNPTRLAQEVCDWLDNTFNVHG